MQHLDTELLSEAPDEDFDRIRIAIEILIVEMFDELGARHDLALVMHEIGEQAEFERGELDGEPVKLTAQEYKLLSYLLHHKGKVVSRTELIEHIYDQDFDRDSNTIEVFVTRIRKKLGADNITTIRGLGYQLDDPQG